MPDCVFNKQRPKPEWIADHGNGYYEAIWQAQPDWADVDRLRAYYRLARRRGLVVDHIVPLRHPDVCGLHVPWNMQLLTKFENDQKGNRWWPDMWNAQERFPWEPEPHQLSLEVT